MLKAVLSAQSGNHGLPPSRVSLPAHAAMAAHYDEGGFYPRGGAKSIPRAYIRELRRRGGSIRMRTRVKRIVVEGKRAVGVDLEGGEMIRAQHIVCNADPAMTYGKLLASEHCKRQLWNVKRMEYSVALVSIFCAVDMDLKAMGYDSGNYWWYRGTDVDDLYARMEKKMPGPTVDGLFLTITTLKDPGHSSHGHHTLEMFTFVPYGPFEKWSASPPDVRSPDYLSLKRALGDKILEAAENVIPRLRDHVKFLEVGTPLTNDFYCETYRGASYGTAKTPWQLGPFSFDQRGPVKGLHFCGASTLSHGVGGASLSGLFAAQHVLEREKADDLLGPADGSLRIYPADRPEEWLVPGAARDEDAASAEERALSA
jgi:phytoene dehydrogenase-like protein